VAHPRYDLRSKAGCGIAGDLLQQQRDSDKEGGVEQRPNDGVEPPYDRPVGVARRVSARAHLFNALRIWALYVVHFRP